MLIKLKLQQCCKGVIDKFNMAKASSSEVRARMFSKLVIDDTKSPSKLVTQASVSPLKKKTNITSINGNGTSAKKHYQDYTNWITSAETAVDDIDVHWVAKWTSVLPEKRHLPPQNAYLYPYKEYYNNNNGVLGNSSIIAFMHRRDPFREGQITLPGWPGEEGKSFPWDLLVTKRSSDDDTAESMGKNIAKEFVKFGFMHRRNKEIFKYMPGMFGFKEEVTANPPKPLNFYMCDVQCLSLLKRTYCGNTSRNDVMNNDALLAKCKFIVIWFVCHIHESGCVCV